MDDPALSRIANDVEFLKKVMILDLAARGFSQDDIASLLGVGQSTVSSMFPKDILKKAKRLGSGSLT
jgi:predicted XRE-type DNA-binding protein